MQRLATFQNVTFTFSRVALVMVVQQTHKSMEHNADIPPLKSTQQSSRPISQQLSQYARYYTKKAISILIIWRGRQTTAIWKADFEPQHESINHRIAKTVECERTL